MRHWAPGSLMGNNYLNVSVNVVSFSLLPVSLMLPLCILIICREILSPMPVPDGFVVKNGMNISSLLYLLTGMPLLLTLTTTLSAVLISAVMLMWLAPACIAFLSRLMKILDICSLSA